MPQIIRFFYGLVNEAEKLAYIAGTRPAFTGQKVMMTVPSGREYLGYIDYMLWRDDMGLAGQWEVKVYYFTEAFGWIYTQTTLDALQPAAWEFEAV